ncbi:hypothetical protein QBC44DRAFT_145135 [Cladorrhinum sp. PSN332]|nr:hypothetical protein QBC44DRAFT_145135 [Cladorrhinum sp. PSN332]
MAKKNSGTKKQADGDGDANGKGGTTTTTTALILSQMSIAPTDPLLATTASASAKTWAKNSVAAPSPQPQSTLNICRNKHWRYISAYHGGWLQLPPEILENLANLNYNTPRPRPIDPAVFFDVSKIRRLVDQATGLAIRAASGQASNNQLPGTSSHSHQAASLGTLPGFRSGREQMSSERKFRVREQACQKLACAYRLDEIACSVNIMQSASALEKVGKEVLDRSPHDPDATYVHFFHEKIPSRQLAECTDFNALNTVIQWRPKDPEPLRTRGTVKIFKKDFRGAIADFTEALKVYQANPHAAGRPVDQILTRTGRVQEVFLKEEEQPSSLEASVYFQRAGAHLSIACQNAAAAFPQEGTPESDMPSEVLEARKQVRTNAKRALRDYVAFLSRFEFSPNLPLSIAQEFARKVNIATGGKDGKARYAHRSGSPDGAVNNPPHKIYQVSELFTPTPPTDLLPYPNEVAARGIIVVDAVTTTETVTYHPLMTEALHCLLICHCLIQTSAKELLRHAYMVARLARLSDGYPIFQTSRSPARSDWMEILRATNNWIQLSGKWEDLCRPAPVPLFKPGPDGTTSVYIPHDVAQSLQGPLVDAAKSLTLPPEHAATPNSMRALETAKRIHARREEAREQHEQEQLVLETLGDERVRDADSFNRAMTARKLRAERDYRIDNAVRRMDLGMIREAQKLGLAEEEITAATAGTAGIAGNSSTSLTTSTTATADNTPSTPAAVATKKTLPGSAAPQGADTERSRLALARTVAAARDPDGADYPILTDRAMSVARWVLEAPPNAGIVPGEKGGARKRKKKPSEAAKKTTTSSAPADDAAPPPPPPPPPEEN